MDIVNDIRGFLADSSKAITREWLEEAQAKYPYFTLPALLYLHRNKDTEGLDEVILGKLAIASPDRKSLCAILGENAVKFASFYPSEPEPEPIYTDETLDTFLST